MARQVSHPAVCRVYDVGEADGHLFLSMELVDGENLASLAPAHRAAARRQGARHRPPALRRPRRRAREGRPAPRPQARQRDARRPGQRPHHRLRPRRPRRVAPRRGHPLGHARATCRPSSSRAGGHGPQRHLRPRPACSTSSSPAAAPSRASRSPSSRAGTGTSGRSSPRPSWPASTPPSSAPSSPASRRSRGDGPPPPSSSSAMLTGSDPLEAAIAAGETPSPELVAAAGEPEGLRAGVAWSLLAFVLAGLVAVPFVARSFQLLAEAPDREAPGRARGPGAGVPPQRGPDRAPVDDAWGLGLDYGLHRPRPREGLVGRAVGGALEGDAAGPAVLVPPEPSTASSPGCPAAACTGRSRASTSPTWPASPTTRAGACCASTRSRRSSRASAPASAASGLDAALRRGAPRPRRVPPVDPEVDAPLPLRRAGGVGGGLGRA